MEFDSIVVYRYPGEDSIKYLKGKLEHGIQKGFVIAPFCNIENEISTISHCQSSNWTELETLFSNYCNFHSQDSLSPFNISGFSTTKTQHRNEVECIISELNRNENEKTIACRRICKANSLDIKNSFLNLAEQLKSAFIFLFITPKSGCWLGASPELLLKSKDGVITTYALAGTRPASNSTSTDMALSREEKLEKENFSEPWDDKNIKEHRIVAEYIGDKFRKWGLYPQFSNRGSRRAGNVEHLFQTIQAQFKPNSETCFDLISFTSDFSPTPALCGMPKEESLDRISRLEDFDREYYGGFCGIFEDMEHFSFYVILRSIKFNSSKWCFYAGGGITANSDPEKEWKETELKLSGILNKLKFLD